MMMATASEIVAISRNRKRNMAPSFVDMHEKYGGQEDSAIRRGGISAPTDPRAPCPVPRAPAGWMPRCGSFGFDPWRRFRAGIRPASGHETRPAAGADQAFDAPADEKRAP